MEKSTGPAEVGDSDGGRHSPGTAWRLPKVPVELSAGPAPMPELPARPAAEQGTGKEVVHEMYGNQVVFSR